MKKYDLPCNVIVDLLPLYNEGACSEESREIVEEHLQSCEECRELCGNIAIPVKEADTKPSETETFRKVSKKLKKSRFSKLISTILCIFLVGVTILSGAWYYTAYRPYSKLAQCLSPTRTSGKLKFDYRTYQDGYELFVAMPNFLHLQGGYAGVNISINDYSDQSYNPPFMFIWVSNKETKYGICIVEKNGRSSSTGYQMYVDKELNYVPSETLNDEMNDKCRQLLEEHHEEIEGLMSAAQKTWGEYLP